VLQWLAHGSYSGEGFMEAVEIFEVTLHGASDDSGFEPPASTDAVRREDDTILGWRPAPGLQIPNRPSWVLKTKLDERGFSEAWLAEHRKTHDTEVFKFCFEVERLRGLQREVTIFRLLKDALGNRRDIARILDWNFEQPPYFVEAEYAKDGNLIEWLEEQGGFEQVPLDIRLEIIAQVAEALSAAHSVGVLHKDIRPESVLISIDTRGRPRTCLTSFGVGQITEWERLAAAKITVMGFLPEPTAGDEVEAGLYLAPEVLEGKTPTMQADIYSLGVMLYQLVVGDLHRAMAPGWQRDVADEMLGEDIAAMVDGKPEKRLANAAEAAQRLRSLEQRRSERQAEHKAAAEARQAGIAAEQVRRLWRTGITVAAIAGLLLLVIGFQLLRVSHRLGDARIRIPTLEAELAAASSDAEIARAQVQLLQSLFTAGQADEPLNAAEVLDQGLARTRRELADQPLARAGGLCSLGIAYRNLMLYEQADALLEEAIELATQHPGSGDRLLETALRERAALLRLRGRTSEAEALEARANRNQAAPGG
jgi:serine/threonine-protein kinase